MTAPWSVRVAEWLALSTSDLGVLGSNLEAKFSSWLYSALLHRAFHYQFYYIKVGFKVVGVKII